ncbi:unnamed protein product [Staurois parvus]|uniref:Uncharacterized protein n=1 Tax=Staurois parvus TaxID=386267 RepID=A0ABN9GY27_9NEOB|nr:unnamed protein product [Staurois parvus]
MTSEHCALQHAMTPLCHFTWLAGVPSCFHFVIIPLTVDHGILSSKEISQMGLLHRRQRLNLLSS